jgi:hypothetical protein
MHLYAGYQYTCTRLIVHSQYMEILWVSDWLTGLPAVRSTITGYTCVTQRTSDSLAQAVVHSQVASQGTGVCVHHVGVAVY